jgi:hypothetical protein
MTSGLCVRNTTRRSGATVVDALRDKRISEISLEQKVRSCVPTHTHTDISSILQEIEFGNNFENVNQRKSSDLVSANFLRIQGATWPA